MAASPSPIARPAFRADAQPDTPASPGPGAGGATARAAGVNQGFNVLIRGADEQASVLRTTIFGRPLGFWIFALVVSAASSYGRWRRVRRRIAEDPFKGMKPDRSEISCPRCRAPYPEGYEPVSHRELVWKGIVCRACGCEYDDYGRERKE